MTRKMLGRQLKDIVVFINSSPANAENQLHFAAEMAVKHDARLLGVHVEADPPRCFSNARGGSAIRSMLEVLAVRTRRTSTEIGRRFLRVASQYKARAIYRVIRSDPDTSNRIVLNTMLADVVIIGATEPHGLPENWTPERLLSQCGVPVLMVPAGWTSNAVPSCVTLAWNSSKEASRAIAGAMPLLSRAKTISVLAVDHDDDQSSIDLALHLARHGVRAKISQITANGLSVGRRILHEAERMQSDLIVMGAYGRNRAARLLFGGTTRTIVSLSKIPILMSL